MMHNKTLYLVRHGNTFDNNQVLLRVGCRTDLPLSSSGKEQLHKLANYITSNDLQVEQLYASNLLRAKESAQIILQACNLTNYHIEHFLNELDYGIDDGKPEDIVLARIGQKALNDWDQHNIAPNGWLINPQEILANWQKFIKQIFKTHNNVMLVTSNGLAKFLPQALGLAQMPKIATGSLSKLVYQGKWQIEFWNHKP